MNYSETKELIASAKSRYNHQQSKIALQAKYTSLLTVVYNGGLWPITESLIAFINSLDQEQIILLDSYNKPIELEVNEFKEIIMNKYNEVMKDWLTEYEKLSKMR